MSIEIPVFSQSNGNYDKLYKNDLIIAFDFDYSLHLPMEGREGPVEEEKSKRVN